MIIPSAHHCIKPLVTDHAKAYRRKEVRHRSTQARARFRSGPRSSLPPGGPRWASVRRGHRRARDAAPLAKEFISHDIPDDFLSDLEADIKAFEDAIKDRESGKGTNVAARAAINTAMEAGLAAVRRLDAIVPNRVGNDDTTIAVWEHARRVEYPWSRGKSEPAATAPSGSGPLPSNATTSAPSASPTN